MAKTVKPTSKSSGGEKIDAKKAATAQKLYWEVLVGKKKISAANCPESISFDLHKLKAYLNEIEAEFNRLNVPYGERSVSVMPIAYDEKGTFSVMFTPAVSHQSGTMLHQFNKPSKTKKASGKLKLTLSDPPPPAYDFQLPPANDGATNP
jgi:hypothetical protein